MRQTVEAPIRSMDVPSENPLTVELTHLQRSNVLYSIGTAMDQALLAMRRYFTRCFLEEYNGSNAEFDKFTSWNTDHAQTATVSVLPHVAIYGAKPDEADKETIDGIAQSLSNGDIKPFKQAFRRIAALVDVEWLLDLDFVGKYSIVGLSRATNEGVIPLTPKQQSQLEEIIIS